MDVQIVNQPDLRIAGIRHIGPYQEIGTRVRRPRRLANGPPPAGVADDRALSRRSRGHAAGQLRSDAALTLPGKTPGPAGLIEQHIPAGRYAKAVHKGGYEGLPATWNALKSEWLPKSGHKMGHPSYEVYVNNPMTTEKSELLTEIYLRLE